MNNQVTNRVRYFFRCASIFVDVHRHLILASNCTCFNYCGLRDEIYSRHRNTKCVLRASSDATAKITATSWKPCQKPHETAIPAAQRSWYHWNPTNPSNHQGSNRRQWPEEKAAQFHCLPPIQHNRNTSWTWLPLKHSLDGTHEVERAWGIENLSWSIAGECRRTQCHQILRVSQWRANGKMRFDQKQRN